jgi:hypothetical protein
MTQLQGAGQINGWPAAAVFGSTLYVLYQSTNAQRLRSATSGNGGNWSISGPPPTNSANYPFGTVLTLTQAEYNALTEVT